MKSLRFESRVGPLASDPQARSCYTTRGQTYLIENTMASTTLGARPAFLLQRRPGSSRASDKVGEPNAKGENYVADIDRRLPGFWREDRHLSFFLAFLVLMTIFVPMVGESRPGRIAIDLTFALMLLSGAIATVYKRMLMYLIIALTILEFTADLIVEFNPSFSPRGWDTALKVFCMAILVVMTLKQTFSSRPGFRAPGHGRRRRLPADRRDLGVRLQAAPGNDSRRHPLPNAAGRRSCHRRTVPFDLFQL